MIAEVVSPVRRSDSAAPRFPLEIDCSGPSQFRAAVSLVARAVLIGLLSVLCPTIARGQDFTRPSSSGLFRNARQPSAGFGMGSPLPYPGDAERRALGGPTDRPKTSELGGALPTGDPSTSEADSTKPVDTSAETLRAFREAGAGAVDPSGYVRKAPQGRVNFRIGAMNFRVGAGLSSQFSDNIFGSASDRESDLITTPIFYLTGQWKISRFNDLSLRVGAGYSFYLAHPELNSFAPTLELEPGTDFALKMRVGKVNFSLYERPVFAHESLLDLTVRSGLFYTSFQNSAGFRAFWEVNSTVDIQGGYEHTDSIPLTKQSAGQSSESSGQKQADQNSLSFLSQSMDSIFASITFRLTDSASMGLDGATSWVKYRGGFQNDGVTSHLGVYIGTRLTHYISARAAMGYQVSTFGTNGSNQDSSGASGAYGNLQLTHQVNRFVSHAFSIGRETALGTTTNTVGSTFVHEAITLNIFRAVPVNIGVFYDVQDESGPSGQSIAQWGCDLSCSYGYQINRRLRMDAYYQFQMARRSGGGTDPIEVTDQTRRGSETFYQNRIGINFVYAF